MVYDKPSDITISVGEWNEVSANTTTLSIRQSFFGERTFSQMMGHEDFAVDLHGREHEEKEGEGTLTSCVEFRDI